MLLLAVYSAVKDNPEINESLSIYEQLRPANETLKPLVKKKN